MNKKDVKEPVESNKFEDFEFENREQPPEEEKLVKEKQKEIKETEQETTNENEAPEQEQKQAQSFGMLGSVISIAWNLIAPSKGYEPINEQETQILREVWTPVELKYLGSLNSPELQAVVITGTVLIPKYINAKRKKAEDKTKVEGVL